MKYFASAPLGWAKIAQIGQTEPVEGIDTARGEACVMGVFCYTSLV